MAQTLSSPTATPPPPGEFIYQPIPASAPLSAGAGALACLGPIWHLAEGVSPLSIVAWTFVCLAAGTLGLLTIAKIRKTEGAFSGTKTATTGDRGHHVHLRLEAAEDTGHDTAERAAPHTDNAIGSTEVDDAIAIDIARDIILSVAIDIEIPTSLPIEAPDDTD